MLGPGALFRARVARRSNKPDSSIEVRLGSSSGTHIATIDVPETGGWQTYETVETTVPAIVGRHPLFLKFVESGTPTGTSLFDMNWFELALLPVEYQAEEYAAQGGTTLEPCSDAGGGTNVANISNGNSCRYDNVFIASNAVFRGRIARPSGRADGRIEIRATSRSGTLLGTLDVPETGGWQTWETVEVPLTVTSGTYSVYLRFVEVGTSNGGTLFNLNRFSITPSSQVDPPGNITAQPITATQIDLAWNDLTNASSYNLKRATTSGGPYSALIGGLSVTNHSDLGVLAGTNYFYVATALYGSAESGDSVELSSIPSDPISPEDVVLEGTTVVDDGSGGFALSMSVLDSGLGHNYQAEATDDLISPVWINATGVLPGNGGELLIQIPFEANLFYRLKVWRQ